MLIAVAEVIAFDFVIQNKNRFGKNVFTEAVDICRNHPPVEAEVYETDMAQDEFIGSCLASTLCLSYELPLFFEG